MDEFPKAKEIRGSYTQSLGEIELRLAARALKLVCYRKEAL